MNPVAAVLRSRPATLESSWRLLAVSAILAFGCDRNRSNSAPETSTSSAPARAVASSRPLQILQWEEAPALPPIAGGLLGPARPAPFGASPRCPAEMVAIRGEYCIDRFEITLLDGSSDRQFSPHYHPTRAGTRKAYERYRSLVMPQGDAPALPEPPAFQLETAAAPRARSMASVIPQGYLNASVAESACAAAGKRLCSLAEWVTACRGEKDRRFPYGDVFAQGACNVHRGAHPAFMLYRDASREHLDPRLNLVSDTEGPLLRKTGQTGPCRSEWGSDSVFDMVGNLDEWVADGSFVGGFYARATREGCDARISSHAREYFDYSLGARCCRSLSGLGDAPSH